MIHNPIIVVLSRLMLLCVQWVGSMGVVVEAVKNRFVLLSFGLCVSFASLSYPVEAFTNSLCVVSTDREARKCVYINDARTK